MSISLRRIFGAAPAASPLQTSAILGALCLASLQAGAQAPSIPAGTSVTVAQAAAPAAPAQNPAAPAAAPAAPAGPAPGTISYSGLLDIYYGINVRAPHGAGSAPFTGVTTVGSPGEFIGIDNAGRAFDINDRSPGFSLGEINITRTAGKGFPLGFTGTFTVGDTARLVHANEPGGTSSWENIQQLYLTYTPHLLGKDVAIDFGEWVTPFGYEVIESSANDEYSRSFGFNYAIPLYHAGIRATVPVSSTITALGAIVNGWNNIADDNNAKSLIGQVTWKPTAKFSANLTYMGGAEGTGAFGSAVPTNGAGDITINLGEFQPTYQLTDKLKIAGEFDIASAAGSISGIHKSGDWLGYAGYIHYQWSPKIAFAGRLEQFEDTAGAGGAGLRLGLGGYTKLNSLTLTAEYDAFHGHLVSRLEYRHDHSNVPFFGAGGATVQDQDTFTLGEVYKF